MNVFDSIKDNSWNGKNIKIEKNNLTFSKNGKASHKIELDRGSYSLNFVLKKRTGNGKINFSVLSSNGDILFSKDVSATKSTWTEYRFSFEIGLDYKHGFLKIDRPDNAFGTVELGRVRLNLDDSEEREKKIGDLKARKKKNKDVVLPSIYDLQNFAKRNERIAVVVPYGIYGGAEIYIKRIIENINLDNYDIEFLYMNKNKMMFIFDDPRINKKLCRSIDSLKGTLKSNDYDYIIYYNRADIYKTLSSLKQNKEIGSKLIEIYHSDFEWPGSLSKIKERKNIDLLISVSDSLALDISGIEKHQRKVIPVGIDLDKFNIKNRDDSLREKYLQDKYKYIIGTVARISPEKNVDYILQLAPKMKECFFLIAGDGPDLKNLKETALNLDIENIEFIGFQKNIEKIYPIFDAFLLPSRMEGTPISILEAMACGVPVFTSNVGAISDIVKDGETGFFIRKNPFFDVKIIRQNISNNDVRIAALNYVERKHDVFSNSKIFIKNIVNVDDFFEEAEIKEDDVILEGEFI